MSESSKISIKESLINFDWKAATGILTVLAAAALFWLGNFFVTQKEYQADKAHSSEVLNLKLEQVNLKVDRMQQDTTETKQLVKEMIQEQRKLNK